MIPKFTLGMGDRFAHEGEAQLAAIQQANARGIAVNPVWNKSNREHLIVGSEPADLRAEADAAVHALAFTAAYFVDADHINLGTVDRFLDVSDFFTLDVADFTGKAATDSAINAFVASISKYTGELKIPGIETPFLLTDEMVRAAAGKFLFAMQEAGRIYQHIVAGKGADAFVTEVSVDETDTPQNPVELFLILAMIAQEGIPAQTVAPKFTGRFNKGVDYVGDLATFEKEFDEDLSVLAFAVQEFGLPSTLKLSVHSGSDKFSLYPVINKLVKKHHAGLHLKTAGTTWLEEVIGLAEAGGNGLLIAKEIYSSAYPHADELIAPYAPVVDITVSELPEPADVDAWTSEQFVGALRHDQTNAAYDLQFRQFLHVSFKIAAKMGDRYTQALRDHRQAIARNVTGNLLDRHILPVFS